MAPSAQASAESSTFTTTTADHLASPLFPPISALPNQPNKSFLCDLPIEIRLEIWRHLHDANNLPRSYGYTCPSHLSNTHRTVRKHGMLFVNKQLSAEYCQQFYERTRFFLHIDKLNAFTGAPALLAKPPPPGQLKETVILNFWNAPHALLQNLRHCTVYIEIGEIASCGQASHSLSEVNRANSSMREARRVRMEMQTFRSLEEYKAADSSFDAAIQTAIHKLLEVMEQLRDIQLVWESTVPNRMRSISSMADSKWGWSALGEPFVDQLKMKRSLRKFQIKVGDRYTDIVHSAVRGEGGKWRELQY